MANLADHGNQVACATCALSSICNSPAVAQGAPDPVECRRRVAAGESIYAAGSQRTNIYALRAGLAQVVIGEGRNHHVVRFLLPGDAAGLDAFAGGRHRNGAVALEDTEVCVIPAYRAEILGRYSEATCSRLRLLMAEQIARDEEHALMLARLTAPQRVARFLLELSRRWTQRGYSGRRFRLPMGRRAIGEHLALTTETVSRVLSSFQSRGWVALPWREVEIRQVEKLLEVLDGADASAEPQAHQQ